MPTRDRRSDPVSPQGERDHQPRETGIDPAVVARKHRGHEHTGPPQSAPALRLATVFPASGSKIARSAARTRSSRRETAAPSWPSTACKAARIQCVKRQRKMDASGEARSVRADRVRRSPQHNRPWKGSRPLPRSATSPSAAQRGSAECAAAAATPIPSGGIRDSSSRTLGAQLQMRHGIAIKKQQIVLQAIRKRQQETPLFANQ